MELAKAGVSEGGHGVIDAAYKGSHDVCNGARFWGMDAENGKGEDGMY
ncbi:hypothetical protein PT974_02926 [Cladobotryum mycophilum]|uniref:Uncharacterized protein n=1 Tax=Cladobotryum mycophilum TaxID=491253 RepID=A0ABR0SZM0_9HYPO